MALHDMANLAALTSHFWTLLQPFWTPSGSLGESHLSCLLAIEQDYSDFLNFPAPFFPPCHLLIPSLPTADSHSTYLSPLFWRLPWCTQIGLASQVLFVISTLGIPNSHPKNCPALLVCLSVSPPEWSLRTKPPHSSLNSSTSRELGTE